MTRHRQVRDRASARLGASLALAAALSWTGAARADDIPMPSTCPPGSQPDGCHWAEYCSPSECRSDSDCAEGTRCREVDQCRGTAPCQTNARAPDAGTRAVTHVLGLCAEGTTCSGECVRTRGCVVAEDEGDGRFASCDCRHVADRRALFPGALTLLVAALALGLARRRR